MKIKNKDLDFFLKNIYVNKFSRNFGGMRSPDMFTLYLSLKNIKPNVIIESGVHNGFSTLLIRKTLGKDVKIICLDPKEISLDGYVDKNINTIYYLGNNFIDFSNLDLSNFENSKIFCFFDDHINALDRLKQCIEKKIMHIVFNDNYPINVGGFYSMEHYFNKYNKFDSISDEERLNIDKYINIYHIFPNIFKCKIKFNEGHADCKYIYENMNNVDASNYYTFFKDKHRYTFNTYIELKY
jgi:hypothetical protein